MLFRSPVAAPAEASAAAETPAAPVENLENLAPTPAAEGEGPVPAPTPAEQPAA